jgi:hypothetical protein
MKYIVSWTLRVLVFLLMFTFWFLPYFVWHAKMPQFYHVTMKYWKNKLKKKTKPQTY